MIAKSSLPYSINVFAPSGGFGNHIRWLLFLNSEFTFSVHTFPKSYDAVSGPRWPSYSDYCAESFVPDAFLLSDPLYIQYCAKLHLDSIESKIKFIKDRVYDDNRSWHNWLSYEWQYRDSLNTAINFSHEITQPAPGSKNIMAITSAELSLRSYVKFNSSLNNETIPYYIDSINSFNRTAQEFNHNDSVLLIESDRLYQSDLPYDLYDSIIDFLGIENLYYDAAKEIHEIWFNLHCSAERDIVSFLQDLYSKPFVAKHNSIR